MAGRDLKGQPFAQVVVHLHKMVSRWIDEIEEPSVKVIRAG